MQCCIIKIDADERETVTVMMLSALGNESRLRIWKLLVRAGFDRLNVGDIQKRPKIPASTLSHHIVTLRHAELLIQRREGSGILVSAGYETMANLITCLTEECCADVGGWGA